MLTLISRNILAMLYGFDVSETFSMSDGSGFGKNVIIFGADTSSSAHIENSKIDILILDKYPRQG